MMNSIPGVFYAVFGFNFCSLLYLFVNYRNRPLSIDKICLSYPLLCLPPHSPHVEALLTISFIETQRDIIANNQQYNNRFNYAVSFHFGQDSNSSHLENISLSCFRTTSSRLQSTPCLHSFPSTSSSSSNVQPTSTFYASSFFRLNIQFS